MKPPRKHKISTHTYFIRKFLLTPDLMQVSLCNTHDRRPGRSPLPILLHKHSQNPSLRRDGEIPAGVRDFENRVICRQSNISVNRHQLEFLWIGSGTADDIGGFCSASGLRSNHLGLVLDISGLSYLEKLIGPILSPEIHAVLSLNLVIPSAAQPLVVYVIQNFLQSYPVLIAHFHRRLRKCRRRKTRKHQQRKHTCVSHRETPLISKSIGHSKAASFAATGSGLE